jgi:deoxyguanosine kinase
MNQKFIAIEGVIGVGKTTLARLLQPKFKHSSILLEVFEENPFLAEFYQDRERFAFQTQIFFLLSRYHQQHQAVPKALQKGTLIADYTFAKDELFAWLNLKDDELAMYGRVHAALGEKIPKPDLIVYLQADHDVIMRRITQRDRPYERDMDPEYIKKLAAAYEAWLSKLQETAVLTVNVNDLDFLADADDLEQTARLIKETLAAQAPSQPPIDGQMKLLHDGRIPDFQEFHRRLDASKGFDPDLYINYILLTEEMGEVASELVEIWRDSKRLMGDGHTATEAHQEAINKHRASLRNELADLLAYTIKLANYTGIDLEQAYLEKMKKNIGRHWPDERTLPTSSVNRTQIDTD